MTIVITVGSEMKTPRELSAQIVYFWLPDPLTFTRGAQELIEEFWKGGQHRNTNVAIRRTSRQTSPTPYDPPSMVRESVNANVTVGIKNIKWEPLVRGVTSIQRTPGELSVKFQLWVEIYTSPSSFSHIAIHFLLLLQIYDRISGENVIDDFSICKKHFPQKVRLGLVLSVNQLTRIALLNSPLP